MKKLFAVFLGLTAALVVAAWGGAAAWVGGYDFNTRGEGPVFLFLFGSVAATVVGWNVYDNTPKQ